MATAIVEKATSDALQGPDWSINMEICDLLNRDPGHAKDIIKAIKKRISHKNFQIQLLALTLLEAIIKNCGDEVHMQVADRDVLHEMVKIVKKKPDYRVKEKILTLIDNWQEAFGGPNAKYLQYYYAYQDLLRAGAVFPQRLESPVPIFTPPQTQPLQNYPPSMRVVEHQRDTPPQPSEVAEIPTLSQTEIKSAREVMEVLSEMLNALDPGNREGLKEDVIVDLVAQCRSYKQKVIQLVNSTQNEELLSQGLALNDDLERVLGKHDAIAAGIAFRTEAPRAPKVPSNNAKPAVAKLDAVREPERRSSASASSSGQSPFDLLALPPPPSSSRSTIPPPASSSKSAIPPPAAASSTLPSVKVTPSMDLLSGDDILKPEPEVNSLALVPVNDPFANSASDQNVLAFADMFAENISSNGSSNPPNTSSAAFNSLAAPVSNFAPSSQQQQVSQHQHIPHPPQQQQQLSQLPQQQPSQLPEQRQPSFYNNGLSADSGLSYGSSAHYASDLQQPQQTWQYGVGGEDLPPPPWEIQTVESSKMPGTQYGTMPGPGGQVGGVESASLQYGHLGHGGVSQPMDNQVAAPLPQAVPQSQYGSMYPSMPGVSAVGYYPQMLAPQYPGIAQQQLYGGQMPAYGYGQQGAYYAPNTSYAYAGANDLSQSMYGLNMQDPSTMASGNGSSAAPISASSAGRPAIASKPEDALFGDLLNIAKTKQNRPGAGRIGSGV